MKLTTAFAIPIALLAVAAPASAQIFSAKQFDAGPLATLLATGDFDGDGHLDVAAAGLEELRILLGSGDGTFTPSRALDIGDEIYAISLVAGDLDGDGRVDLVTVAHTELEDSVIVAMLGDGAGSFVPLPAVAIDVELYASQLADLDGDGDLDLAVLQRGLALGGTGSLIPVFNDGTGVFTFGAHVPLGPYPAGLDLGDLNGDGALDAVVADLFGTGVDVLLGDGAGGFGPAVGYPATNGSTSVRLADLDRDGALDAIVGSQASGTHPVAVLLGDGAGGFGAPTLFSMGAKQAHIEVDDLNGDGKLDVVTVPYAQGPIQVAFGNGAGGLLSAKEVVLESASQFILLRDADEDGALDLLVASANYGPFSLTVARGDGAGGFEAPHGLSGLNVVRAIVPADVDGSGTADLVLLSFAGSASRISVMTGNGAGQLSVPIPGATVGNGLDLALGDWNGDGRPDAAIARSLPNSVGISFGTGTAFYPAPAAFPLPVAPSRIAAGDVNDDGSLDVVVAGGTTLMTLLGDGAGGLAAPITSSFSDFAFDLALADFDRDGKLDAAAAAMPSLGQFRLALSSGDGAGGFAAPALYDTTPLGPQLLAIGDLDRNGAVDAVVAGPVAFGDPVDPADGAIVFSGDGSGGLVAHEPLKFPQGTSDVLVMDADRDGNLDLATVGFRLALRRGDGAGAFGEVEPFSNGPQVGLATSVDLDADGDLDVATVSVEGPKLIVLLNRSTAPSGAAAFGAGTPGCVGTHGIGATSAPILGNADFAIATTNAPTGTLGLALVAAAGDAAGSDPLGVGVALHVDLASGVLAFDVKADAAGLGRVALPIPATPALANVRVYAQTIWAWPGTSPCDPSAFGLSSSRGLGITLMP
ncbi:MAG TPA: VCBS repeat-containing protein [Planctomycetota bacterium]|nr:VCBS repeat-containing protein [Planctomycetota bacterium]